MYLRLMHRSRMLPEWIPPQQLPGRSYVGTASVPGIDQLSVESRVGRTASDVVDLTALPDLARIVRETPTRGAKESRSDLANTCHNDSNRCKQQLSTYKCRRRYPAIRHGRNIRTNNIWTTGFWSHSFDFGKTRMGYVIWPEYSPRCRRPSDLSCS